MQTVAVIGAGQMGSGIAQTSAQFGYRVLLADMTVELAEKAKAKIGKDLHKLVARDKISVTEAEASIARITPVGDYAAFADASYDITSSLTLSGGIRGFIANNSASGFSGTSGKVGSCIAPANGGFGRRFLIAPHSCISSCCVGHIVVLV